MDLKTVLLRAALFSALSGVRNKQDQQETTSGSSPSPEPSPRHTGLVKSFRPSVQGGPANFGFIKADDNKSLDIEVRLQDVKASGLETLTEDQKVSYRIETERGKNKAVDLKLI